MGVEQLPGGEERNPVQNVVLGVARRAATFLRYLYFGFSIFFSLSPFTLQVSAMQREK